MNPLVSEISTAYKVAPRKVEQLIDTFGQGCVEAALTQVKRLPIRPDSPFGWMIWRLGDMGRDRVDWRDQDSQAAWLARRYCNGFHAERNRARHQGSVCFVCGTEATA